MGLQGVKRTSSSSSCTLRDSRSRTSRLDLELRGLPHSNIVISIHVLYLSLPFINLAIDLSIDPLSYFLFFSIVFSILCSNLFSILFSIRFAILLSILFSILFSIHFLSYYLSCSPS